MAAQEAGFELLQAPGQEVSASCLRPRPVEALREAVEGPLVRRQGRQSAADTSRRTVVGRHSLLVRLATAGTQVADSVKRSRRSAGATAKGRHNISAAQQFRAQIGVEHQLEGSKPTCDCAYAPCCGAGCVSYEVITSRKREE